MYELKGRDVYVNVPVGIDEAALGATIEVPAIDGKTVKVKIPAGSSTDKVLRVRLRGVKSKHRPPGDMYVRLKVVVPAKLSAEAKKALEDFRAVSGEADPRREFSEMAKV